MKKLLPALALLAFPAFANAASVYIANIYPTGAIEPGTMVTFSAIASGFVDPAYSVNGGGSVDVAGNYTWTPAIANAGRNTITVSVSDSTGASSTASTIIQVAADNLVVSAPSPATVAVGKTVTFSISAPGFTSPTFYIYDSYTGNNSTIGTVDASGNFSWTSDNSPGSHHLTIIGSDPYGHNATASTTLTVVSPSVKLPLANPAIIAAGAPFTFIASANGMTSPSFVVSDYVNSFSTTTISTTTISAAGVFNWTPTASDVGLHVITVTATDSLGNAASSTGNILVQPAGTAVPTAPTTPVSTPSTGTSLALQPGTGTIPSYKFLVLLQTGSRGAGVIALQNILIAKGYLGAGNNSGYFGALTSAAVRKYQKAHGLSQVGFVGPGTRAALNLGN